MLRKITFAVLKEDNKFLEECSAAWQAAAMAIVNCSQAAIGLISTFGQLDDLKREAMLLVVAPNGTRHVYRKAFSGPAKDKDGKFTGKVRCLLTRVLTVSAKTGEVKNYDITAGTAGGKDMSFIFESKFLELKDAGYKFYAYRTSFGVRAKERAAEQLDKYELPPV